MARTAILISCTQEEASKIRARAAFEDRGVSSYLRRILNRAVSFDEKLISEYQKLYPIPHVARRGSGPKTAVLLRCSTEQAERIRVAAKRRQATLCGYILHCLNRTWDLNP